MGNRECGRLKGNPCGPLRPNTINVTMPGTGVRGFSGDSGPAIDARLNKPTVVALDGAGNLYIADWGNHRIRILTQVIDSGERAPLFEEIGGLLRLRSAVPTRTLGGGK